MWDKKEKKMYGWGWILENWDIFKDYLTLYKQDLEDGSTISNQAYNKTFDLEFMRYTSLKDKNGKKFCEGDIVKYGIHNKEVKFGLHVIEIKPPQYEDDTGDYFRAYGWYLDGNISLEENASNTKLATVTKESACEIIGNIYSNPELLKN